MGFYINPNNGQKKEEWLRENALFLKGNVPEWEVQAKDQILVCLVNNGPFTAAGICYNKREYDAFAQRSDTRPKLWFVVRKEKIIEVCPEIEQTLNK